MCIRDRLHIDIRMDQLGTANPDIGRGVQKLLRAGGEIDPQILDADVYKRQILGRAEGSAEGLEEALIWRFLCVPFRCCLSPRRCV